MRNYRLRLLEWASRAMLLCTRSEPAAQSPLGTLVAHLECCAAQEVPA